MRSSSDNHDVHDYAKRFRERLPRRLQDLREAAALSMYALAKTVGVSLEMVSSIEGGEAIPMLHVAARLACGQ